MQIKKWCVHRDKLAKSENISLTYLYQCHTHADGVLYLAVGYALTDVCMVKQIIRYHLVSIGQV
jgi:hypothetical protein